MTADLLWQVFLSASDKWEESMRNRDFYDAINTGIGAYFLARYENNEQITKGALNLIHVAIDALLREGAPGKDALSCSFCGRGEPEVRLGAGPDAFICAECVRTFDGILNPPPKS